MNTDMTTPAGPAAAQPATAGPTAQHARFTIRHRVRAMVDEFSPAGDNPFPGTGRISATLSAAVIALCLAIPPFLEILTLVQEHALLVTVDAPSSGSVPAGYEGIAEPAGGLGAQYLYAGAPAWALAACGVLAAAYVVLLFCCAIGVGRVCIATVPRDDANGTDPNAPWRRVVHETRRPGRSVVAAAAACGGCAWVVPSIAVPSPATEESPPLVTAGHFSGVAWITAFVIASFMAFLAHALSRLHDRTTRLTAESTVLREQTEGLV